MTEKRERRPTVTVDLGEESLRVLDSLVAYYTLNKGLVNGKHPWQTATRSDVIRFALVRLWDSIDAESVNSFLKPEGSGLPPGDGGQSPPSPGG